MEMLETAVIAGAVAGLIGVVWFGRWPPLRRARTESDGHPNVYWWASFCTAVVVGAFLANRI
jgi:hypothetical protein